MAYDLGPVYDYLKRKEGYAPVAKWDQKQYSGGYGSRAQPGEVFTPEIAQQRLERDVAPVASWVDQNVKVPLTDQQRTALTSFGYNLGTGNLDKLASDINRGDWQTVAQRMQSFNHAGGEVDPGLTARRNEEASMVLGGQSQPIEVAGNAPNQAQQEGQAVNLPPSNSGLLDLSSLGLGNGRDTPLLGSLFGFGSGAGDMNNPNMKLALNQMNDLNQTPAAAPLSMGGLRQNPVNIQQLVASLQNRPLLGITS